MNLNLKYLSEVMGFTTRKEENIYQREQELKEKARPKKSDRKTIYEWEALARPHRKPLSQKFLRTLMVIGVFFAALLIAAKEFTLIALILGIYILSYALTKNAPETVLYKITNQGLEIEGKFYFWDELKHFFIFDRDDLRVLGIDAYEAFPPRIYLTLTGSKIDEQELIQLLSVHMDMLEEMPENFLDKAYRELISKLNV
ncbi:hypothetical protein H6802_00770 [Candidatus Nomurabacteria bacterium]|uniref:DUF5673 domain-containing protein n=1 Tax=candidate division WWE3 bacterium TaxID=2053526 RepID=A0A955E0M7_UNCKA|nr:hypothetical protein [candidate division WWE3 bacterium]MCB9823477.1 hypothetical protein [Candidatus Nomurabacteria bacterium]MCB9827759.1 hypothetical protein [Candidatus Nomurabacteria bacterium]HXK52364.1 hypothetical protein [bacterium]